MIKVVKFGGTSLADAAQFRKVAAILQAEPDRHFVVPSAPGKRMSGDTKVTDLLLSLHAAQQKGEDTKPLFDRIKERYQSIIDELALPISLTEDFDVMARQLTGGCSVDYIASRGEYLNGKLLAEYLGWTFVDAAEVVCFTEGGAYDGERTIRVMGERLKDIDYAVVPGFYGARPNGEVQTFSRGGSDITGAIVARAVAADLYENWTDVSGFLVCDPHIVPEARTIQTVTYRELRELAYMGASVLHPESIFPVKEARIPINIRNTNAPEDPGTMIIDHVRMNVPNDDIITGIAGRKGFSVLRLEKDQMNEEVGFGCRVLEVLRDFDISFEHLPSSIDTMCVVLDDAQIESRAEELLAALSAAVQPDYICIERDLALVAVVGRGMKSKKGTASRVFKAVADANVNIRMIDQGSSELNIILGIREDDFEKTVSGIYHAFY